MHKKLIKKLANQNELQVHELKSPTGYLPPEMLFLHLPYKDPKKLVWQKRYDKKNLIINWHSGSTVRENKDHIIGIPYGKYSRLLLDYIVTVVKQKDTKIIEFGDTYSDILNSLGVKDVGGGIYKQLKEQWDRIMTCYISFVREIDDVKVTDRVFIADKLLESEKRCKFAIKISDVFYEYTYFSFLIL